MFFMNNHNNNPCGTMHPQQAADFPPPTPTPHGVGGACLIMIKDINIAL